MYRMSASRVVNAPVEVVWAVISERYADYAPNFSKAIKTSNEVTLTRRCYDNKRRGWNEACVLWKEGEVYSLVVDTSPPNYPYPFTQLKGTWRLNELAHGVEIYMHFDYQPNKSGVLGWIMSAMFKRAFTPIVDELLDNWEAEITQRTTQSAA